jgi:sulfofructose kinase
MSQTVSLEQGDNPLLLSENEVFHQSVFKVDVVDTTGAGDAFYGAFLYGLVKGWSLQEIVRFSSATAAIKCTILGGLRGIPGLEEVNEFLKKNIKRL